jgi:hypothetical protein
LLWAGAVAANTPPRPAVDEGAEDVYVVPEGLAGRRARPKGPPPPNLLDAAAHASGRRIMTVRVIAPGTRPMGSRHGRLSKYSWPFSSWA